MLRANRAGGHGFEYAMSVPLIIYVLVICVLVVCVFLRLTPDAIRQAFADPAIRNGVYLSLMTTAASTILSMLVAIPAGYVLSRTRFPGHAVVDTVLDLPIVMPPLVMGLCILLFFNTAPGRYIDRQLLQDIGWLLGLNLLEEGEGLFLYEWPGIILVQFIVGCAFAVRVIKSGFDASDPAQEDVAMALGANRRQTFLKVVLPGIGPSLVAGVVITWARIFGLFGPILLVCGTMRTRSWDRVGTEIMPTTIYLEASIGRLNVALVLAAGMILLSMVTLVIVKRFGGQKYLW